MCNHQSQEILLSFELHLSISVGVCVDVWRFSQLLAAMKETSLYKYVTARISTDRCEFSRETNSNDQPHLPPSFFEFKHKHGRSFSYLSFLATSSSSFAQKKKNKKSNFIIIPTVGSCHCWLKYFNEGRKILWF